MKLGTQTASLINHLQSRAVIGQPEPTIGMGVTLLSWTDRNAGTIVAIEKDKQGRVMIHVTEDDSRVISGSSFDGSADYAYTPRPDGHRYTFRRNDDGMWQEVYQKVLDYDDDGNVAKRSTRWSKVSGGGKGLRIGERETYRDPSF
jgi:hypothetical protein